MMRWLILILCFLVIEQNVLKAHPCDPSMEQMTFQEAIGKCLLLPIADENPNATNSAQTIVINGTWTLTNTYTFTNSTIIMEPGAEIIVANGATLILDNTRVTACRCMWHRIWVREKGRLITRNNTLIQQGQYGIETENGATIDISNTTFLNNFIGIYMSRFGAPRTVFISNFVNNTFRAPRLITAYNGAVTTPIINASQLVVPLSVPNIPLPGPGGGNNPDVPGLAGILAWDMIALNLNTATPSASNQFINGVAGIVTFSSNFSTNSCAFQDQKSSMSYSGGLAFQGCGIHSQSRNGLHRLSVQGMLQTAGGSIPLPLPGANTFQNLEKGISGFGVSMVVSHCGMDRILHTGILAQSCTNSNLSFKSNLLDRMRGTGIGIFNSDFNTTTAVYVNDIRLRPAATIAYAPKIGIHVVEAVANPHLLEIYQNIIDDNNAQLGISITGHTSGVTERSIVFDNTINMDGNTNIARSGIGVFNSNIDVIQNQVVGNQNLLNKPTTGITGSVANGTWQCNEVNRTRTGMFFSGTNALVLEGSTFGNHTNGLDIEFLSSIGQQFSNGNRWTGPAFNFGNPNPGAINRNPNNPGLINASRFEINATNAPNPQELFPNNFNLPVASMPPGWFSQNSSGMPDYSCVSVALLQLNTFSSIDARDLTIANNNFAPNTASEYHGKRKLFRKLVENPSLTQIDPSLPPFIPNHQNGCIGHFDNVAQQCSQAFALSSTDSIQIDSFQHTCKYYLDTLHCLDSLLYVNYDTTTANLRATLATNFGNIIQQQQGFLNVLTTTQQNDLANVAATNSSFSTTILHEQLEKQANEIYLSILALGITEFTPSQITDLQAIAAYCPQEGGAAVHQARGMLSMIQDVNMLDFDCNRNQQARKAQDNSVEVSEKWKVLLFPNPTSKELNIQSNISFLDKSKIEVYNSLGQLVQTHFVNKETVLISINVNSLTSGIYFIRIRNGEQEETLPFVVSKN